MTSVVFIFYSYYCIVDRKLLRLSLHDRFHELNVEDLATKQSQHLYNIIIIAHVKMTHGLDTTMTYLAFRLREKCLEHVMD